MPNCGSNLVLNEEALGLMCYLYTLVENDAVIVVGYATKNRMLG